MSFHKLRVLIVIYIFPLLVNGQFTADVTSGCNPLTVQFIANPSAAILWDWDFGDGKQYSGYDTVVHVYTNPGIYDVVLVTNSSNYTIEEFIKVQLTPRVYFDTITIQYASFTILCRDTSVYDNPVEFVWDFGDGTEPDTITYVVFTHKYESEGTYTIKHVVRDGYTGCVDSLSKTITITHQFIIPNVFTPNGDGINDWFEVLANGLDFFPQIIIYNRWGTIVYKIENVSQIVWDGRTFDGALVSPGTYFYVITPPANSNYEYIDSKLKGTIQVIYN